MRYLEEFRSAKAVKELVRQIQVHSGSKAFRFMEVCGGHTLTALRFGIHDLLKSTVELLSGPGCPVCVSAASYIEAACELARRKEIIIASFGDMLRVPGLKTSLLFERQKGAQLAICLSPLDALRFCKLYPQNEIVFLAVGFETTAPAVAATVMEAESQGLKNFSILCALKTMPQALKFLLQNPQNKIDGFICPGHVTTVAGLKMYEPLAKDYGVPCVVSGFEPTDMLRSILELVVLKNQNLAKVVNTYRRAVKEDGNPQALKLLYEVFEPADAIWRGIGVIPGSGLRLKAPYQAYATERRFDLRIGQEESKNSACACALVLQGQVKPPACKLFKKVCRPETPKGACMVSNEGACSIYYRYGSN